MKISFKVDFQVGLVDFKSHWIWHAFWLKECFMWFTLFLVL